MRSGSCSSADEEVVKYLRRNIVFDRPEDARSGMTGADAGTGTIYFEAVAAGQAEVQCQTEFRGRVENSMTFQIQVK